MEPALPSRHASARLELGAARTTIASGNEALPDPVIALAIGTRKTAEQFFRHDPPTPLELETAIDAIENEVMRAHRLLPAETRLIADDDTARAVARAAGLAGTGAVTLPLEAVEQLFQRVASAALGNPAALRGLPAGNEFVAAVLILRELMHHLGWASIALGAAPPAAAPTPRNPRP